MPSLTWTSAPCGRSTRAIRRCRRRSTSQIRPSDGPPFRRTRHEASGLGLGEPAVPAAPALGGPLGLDLGAEIAVAADPREVAAGSLVGARGAQLVLDRPHLGLEPADADHVLVLAERGLDGAPDGSQVLARAQEERDRAVAQAELALDGLGRAVDDLAHLLEAVAHVERHHALAGRVDAPPPGPPGHLRQLVVGEAPEAAVGALGERLQHHRPRRHVDAERHRLGGEDHAAEVPLEQHLGQPLDARQDPGVVEAHAHAERLEDGLVQRRLGHRRVLARWPRGSPPAPRAAAGAAGAACPRPAPSPSRARSPRG